MSRNGEVWANDVNHARMWLLHLQFSYIPLTPRQSRWSFLAYVLSASMECHRVKLPCLIPHECGKTACRQENVYFRLCKLSHCTHFQSQYWSRLQLGFCSRFQENCFVNQAPPANPFVIEAQLRSQTDTDKCKYLSYHTIVWSKNIF